MYNAHSINVAGWVMRIAIVMLVFANTTVQSSSTLASQEALYSTLKRLPFFLLSFYDMWDVSSFKTVSSSTPNCIRPAQLQTQAHTSKWAYLDIWTSAAISIKSQNKMKSMADYISVSWQYRFLDTENCLAWQETRTSSQTTESQALFPSKHLIPLLLA